MARTELFDLFFHPVFQKCLKHVESSMPTEGSGQLPQLHISYKPQKISPKSQGMVRTLLHDKIRDAYVHPQAIFENILKSVREQDKDFAVLSVVS